MTASGRVGDMDNPRKKYSQVMYKAIMNDRFVFLKDKRGKIIGMRIFANEKKV